MEVSSHALALGRVAGTHFAVGAFTNLSQDHLDFHADMDDYFATKASLFAPGRAERAVICVDDEWGVRLAGRTRGAVTVSATGPADWSARDVTADTDGTQHFTALTPHGPVPVALRLPGPFNVANALVALACLDAVGVPPAVAALGVAEVAVPGRMQRIERGQPFLAVVDYAHKPAAVAALLDALRAQVAGRLLVVLGAGGDRDRAKRPLMGAPRPPGPSCWSSPTTTRAPKTPRSSARRCWPVRAANRAAVTCARSATGGARSPSPSPPPAPATRWSWPARDTRPGRRSATSRSPSTTPKSLLPRSRRRARGRAWDPNRGAG